MKWVKHDTDANADAKLQNVLLDYGLEGYGLYWYCIELIAGKVDKDNITFELEHDARIIARNTGSTPQKVEEMMRYFVDSGLFENNHGVVTCMKIAKRLDKSMTSNPEMRAVIENLKSHDSIMTPSEKPMQDKIRLDKNRIDNSKVISSAKADPVPYQKIAELYNESMSDDFPKVQVFDSAKRKTLIKKFWGLINKDISKVQAYFVYFDESAPPFYRGDNDRNWTANFDYIIREDTVTKAREGNL